MTISSALTATTTALRKILSPLHAILYQHLCNKYSTKTHFKGAVSKFMAKTGTAITIKNTVERGIPSISFLYTAPLKLHFFTGTFL